MTGRRAAACCCGGLTAVCEGEPTRVAACHCLACQRRTGGAFGVLAWFPAARVAVAGAATEWSRLSDRGRRIAYRFCPACGSTVALTHEDLPDLIGLPVGAFADPGFPAPTASMWERRGHPWTTVAGDAVEHEL